MNYDVKQMLKQIFILDTIIGLVAAVIIHISFRDYAAVFLLGLLMSFLSLTVASIALNNSMLNKVNKLGVIASLINFAKVFIICIIGILIFNNNINNVISYMLGFTSHFIALICYGILNLYNGRE